MATVKCHQMFGFFSDNFLTNSTDNPWDFVLVPLSIPNVSSPLLLRSSCSRTGGLRHPPGQAWNTSINAGVEGTERRLPFCSAGLSKWKLALFPTCCLPSGPPTCLPSDVLALALTLACSLAQPLGVFLWLPCPHTSISTVGLVGREMNVGQCLLLLKPSLL